MTTRTSSKIILSWGRLETQLENKNTNKKKMLGHNNIAYVNVSHIVELYKQLIYMEKFWG